MTKRLFDVFISVMLLVSLLPLFLVISLLICLWDGRTPYFTQKRFGLKGKLFSIIKFRSMVIDAENRGSFFTEDNDPRITFLGKFLRKSSLDELPQLLNVLKGDMSLVGPRPDSLAQKELYSREEWVSRCSVRPGITGLAQATLRSQATIEERKRMDLEYVKNKSFLLDLKILILTVKQILTKGGN